MPDNRSAREKRIYFSLLLSCSQSMGKKQEKENKKKKRRKKEKT